MTDTLTERPLFQRIWHGDSRELLPKVPDGKVDCIITDPPFGVDNQSNMAVTKGGKEHARKIAGDRTPEEALTLFREVMDILLPKTAENADLYIFTAHQVLELWLAMAKSPWMEQYGFRYKATLVWEKDGPGMGDLDSWGMGHEFIIFLRKGTRERSAPRRSGVIHVPQVRPNKLIHPHEKPTGILELFMRQSTDERDFVVDPFGGSGSLARAARNANRSALCIEYDKKNFDLANTKFHEDEGFQF